MVDVIPKSLQGGRLPRRKGISAVYPQEQCCSMQLIWCWTPRGLLSRQPGLENSPFSSGRARSGPQGSSPERSNSQAWLGFGFRALLWTEEVCNLTVVLQPPPVLAPKGPVLSRALVLPIERSKSILHSPKPITSLTSVLPYSSKQEFNCFPVP